MIRPEDEIKDLLLSITKNCETLLHQLEIILKKHFNLE